jgi:hypothetical protein
MTTVEDIERKQRNGRRIFKVLIALVLLLICVIIAWFAASITFEVRGELKRGNAGNSVCKSSEHVFGLRTFA